MEHKSSIVGKWKILSIGTFLGFFVFAIYVDKVHQDINFLAAKNVMLDFATFKSQNRSTNALKALQPPNSSIVDENDKSTNKTRKKCDVFDGRWVYKPEESARYDWMTCPFINEKFSCQSNGRLDSLYEKWRWEARDCDIPVFNGTYMLERLRNKRMILVGDSINRNMWESLACLLFTSSPSAAATVNEHRKYTNSWKSKEYNFTLEFFWTSFLIDFNKNHESGKNVLVLDKLSPTSDEWKGADIMIFNSGHWWELRRSWKLFEFQGKLSKDMPIALAYERGLKTWATWIEKNVDPNKTKVFFRGYSPVHKFQKYNQWCFNRTQPIIDDSFVRTFPQSMTDVVESLMKGLSKLQVKYLNTTKLSEYRIDAHPSLYITKNEKNIHSYADCSHWCLPGVPDTWNRLLYASLFYENSF